jgi:hypothetical protein
MDRLAAIGLLDDRDQVRLDPRPDVQERASKRGGMLVGQHNSISVVIQQDLRRPPGYEHGLVRVEQDAHERL